MKDLAAKYPGLAVIISGILAGGVFSFGIPALFLPLFISLFFWVVIHYKQATVRKTLQLVALFYWPFYFIVLVWFIDTDVRLLAGLSGHNAKLLLGLCLVIMTTMLTAVSLQIGVIIHHLRPRLVKPDIRAGLVLASAWVVIEWARSWAFSIFLYAPGASAGDYWNFGSLGLGIISTPFGYLSSYFGMYGLSMLVVFFALTIMWALNKRLKPLLITTCILTALGIGGFLLNLIDDTGSTTAASVLQYNGDGDSLTLGMTDYKYLDEAPKDLIVLSEYSKVHITGNEGYAQKYVLDRLSPDGISIDASADFSKPGVRYNTLEARNKQGNVINTQTKQLLIPTGEYLPGILQIFYKVTGQDIINKNFALTRQLSRGQPPKIIQTPSFAAAPVACSGILGRNIYRQLVSDGGQVLTNSASLLIFNGSRAYFRQSLLMARFHAVANQRTYIQASTGASAFVIDDRGQFIVAPEDTKTAFIDFRFVPKSEKSLYTRFGEWPLFVAALITAFYSGVITWKYMRSRRKR